METDWEWPVSKVLLSLSLDWNESFAVEASTTRADNISIIDGACGMYLNRHNNDNRKYSMINLTRFCDSTWGHQWWHGRVDRVPYAFHQLGYEL